MTDDPPQQVNGFHYSRLIDITCVMYHFRFLAHLVL